MNKMERPMMTIVRFGAEDVIATSSRVISGNYSALGSELQEYANKGGYVDDCDYILYDNDDLYNVIFNNNRVTTTYRFANPGTDSGTDQFNYAWYNETSGNWVTDNKTYGYYNGNLPK
jgi:hypothetical protein